MISISGLKTQRIHDLGQAQTFIIWEFSPLTFKYKRPNVHVRNVDRGIIWWRHDTSTNRPFPVSTRIDNHPTSLLYALKCTKSDQNGLGKQTRRLFIKRVCYMFAPTNNSIGQEQQEKEPRWSTGYHDCTALGILPAGWIVCPGSHLLHIARYRPNLILPNLPFCKQSTEWNIRNKRLACSDHGSAIDSASPYIRAEGHGVQLVEPSWWILVEWWGNPAPTDFSGRFSREDWNPAKRLRKGFWYYFDCSIVDPGKGYPQYCRNSTKRTSTISGMIDSYCIFFCCTLHFRALNQESLTLWLSCICRCQTKPRSYIVASIEPRFSEFGLPLGKSMVSGVAIRKRFTIKLTWCLILQEKKLLPMFHL